MTHFQLIAHGNKSMLKSTFLKRVWRSADPHLGNYAYVSIFPLYIDHKRKK
jgi:hypothetical protein